MIGNVSDTVFRELSLLVLRLCVSMESCICNRWPFPLAPAELAFSRVMGAC